MIAAILLAIREHWPKILAAILVPVLIGAIGLWMADRERDETQAEERLVETGRKEVVTQHQQEVLNNVKTAKEAVERPTLDQSERVRAKYERCRGDDC